VGRKGVYARLRRAMGAIHALGLANGKTQRRAHASEHSRNFLCGAWARRYAVLEAMPCV